MTVVVTTRRHRYTLARFRAEHGFPVPRIRRTHYHRLFRSFVVPREWSETIRCRA